MISCSLGPERCSDCARAAMREEAPDAIRWSVGPTFDVTTLAPDEEVGAVVPYGWAVYKRKTNVR